MNLGRCHHGPVTTSRDTSIIAHAVAAFFAKHGVASLRLPSGWFGRPYDGLHRLSEARPAGDHVVIRLDQAQVLMLDAREVSSDGPVLRIDIRGGSWSWTDYGGDLHHEEVLGCGQVAFFAPRDS